MGQSLNEIEQTLKDANKKVQLIYAFNGTGKTRLSRESYHQRILNLSSHSKHSGEEVTMITEEDKRVLSHLIREIKTMYRFYDNNIVEQNDTI